MTDTTISITSTSGQTLKGDDTLTVTATGVLKPSGTAVTWNLGTPQVGNGVVVTNSGTIQSTGGRVFDTSSSQTGKTSFSVVNNAGAFITAASDVMRMQASIGGGAISIDNSGSISAGTGRGFNIQEYVGVGSFSYTNRVGGTLQSANDALRVTTATAGSDTSANPVFTGTVTIDNYGSIKTVGAGSGQALDFNDINATALGHVHITNESTGLMQAADADAIRGSRFATIDNYGQIVAKNFNAASSGNDGIDFQANDGGVVNNYAGGSITGARHGITGKAPITIDNAGTITGQLGSGVNLDTASTTTTTIHNDHGGLIVGNAAGTSDGDGIDVDGLITLENHGTIQAFGTWTGGLSESVTVGGGTIDNYTDGTIYSIQRAITVDDSNGGNAFAATTIYNEGLIQGDNGEAISITDTYADTLTNKGTITGSTALGGGDDVINLYTGSTTGTIDGGDGSDTLNLLGTGTGTLAGVSNVEILSVQGGTWTVADDEAFSGGASIALGAVLQVGAGASAGSLTADVVDNGALSFDRSDTYAFSGAISGSGVVEQNGSGTLVLGGSGSYSGGSEIFSGVLKLASADAAGSGDITFESGAQTLDIAAAGLTSGELANVIDGIGSGDYIEIAGLSGAAASLGAGNVLTISGGSAGPITLHLDPGQDFSGFHFVGSAGADGEEFSLDALAVITGDTSGSVNEAATVGPVSQVSGDLSATDSDDSTDFSVAAQGGYGTLAISTAGHWTYTLDNSNPAVDGLSTGDQLVDHVTVQTADGTTQVIDVTIHGVNDTRTGTSGPDTIAGTSGADTLTGGAGDDTYTVNNAGDTLVEKAGGGHDLAQSSISYTLAAFVEDLTLTGTGDINGTGNDQSNIINGNDGSNVLDGGSAGNDALYGHGGNDTLIGGTGADRLDGGAGADQMSGGVGNDVYVVDNTGDVVTENAKEGTDTVNATVSYALTANVENLNLAAGAGDIAGTGNELKNVIIGNEGANSIDGGLGSDTLTGGAGNDSFVFDTAPNKMTNVDTITDFTVGADTIDLDHGVFSALGTGALAASAFHIGANANAAGQHVIYNATTGDLFYDADGKGGAAQVLFAHLTPGLALTEHDFFVM